VPDVASLSISSVPTGILRVVILTEHDDTNRSVFFPSEIVFSPISPLTTSLTFVSELVSGIGSYNIRMVTVGSEAGQYVAAFANEHSTIIHVLGAYSEPSTPKFQNALFSTDGAAAMITFSGPTDRGETKGTFLFPCSKLFAFTDSNRAKCRWSADSTEVTILPWGFALGVGAFITLQANKLKVGCPTANTSRCRNWASVATRTLNLSAPADLRKPYVQLSLPASVGLCDSLTLDYTASLNSGGRAWSVVNITVTPQVANTSALAAYLESNHRFDHPVVIPSDLLPKGSMLKFTVALCNFLGACGESSEFVTVLSVEIPYVLILGGPTVKVTVNSSLVFASSAYLSGCDGGVTTTSNLVHTWSLYKMNGSALGVLPSKDPTKFVLGAFQLEALASYSVQLTVIHTLSMRTSSSFITLIVGQSAVLVVVAGGSQQSVRYRSSLTLDASESYDSDQVNHGKVGLMFQWLCFTSSPFYSLDGPFTNRSASNSSALTVYTSESSSNATARLTITVFDYRKSSSCSVTVQEISEQQPFVVVNTVTAKRIASTGPAILLGEVSSPSPCTCQWAANDFSVDLSVSSSVPPTKTFNRAGSYSMYLALLPNSLPADCQLTFTLTCLTSTSSTSTAAVVVITNSPPAPGLCHALPLYGMELSTTFKVAASAWMDVDVPLSYEFGFVGGSSQVSFIIQTKSMQTFARSILSSGSARANYSLTTTIQIWDSLDASVTQYVPVQVFPRSLNTSELYELTKVELYESDGNVDILKKSISTILSSLSIVTCENAPNCSALNRLECSSVANTCGACLSTRYVGIFGGSNEACVPVADYQRFVSTIASGNCSSSADCNVWSRCQAETRSCIPKHKTCLANCSNNGRCNYYVSNTEETLDDCSVQNAICTAKCECTDDFYGPDCSLNWSQFYYKRSIMDQLLSAVQRVTELESIDAQSTPFLLAALQSLTSDTAWMTLDSGLIIYNISCAILESTTTNINPDSGIAVVVDNVISTLISRWGTNALEGRGSPSLYVNIFDYLSSSLSLQLIPGQINQAIIMNNYRLGAGVISDPEVGWNFSVVIPQTSLEVVSGMPGATLSLMGAEHKAHVGLASVPKILSTQGGSSDNITSNSFRIVAEFDDVSGGCQHPATWLLVFAHYDQEFFGDVDATMTTVTTICRRGSEATIMVNCPHNISRPVICNGSTEGTVLTTCPTQKRSPKCALRAGTGLTDTSSCVVVNYTAASTVCRCRSCASSNTDVTARRLTVGSLASTGTEVAALSTYSFTEFASVMESARSFNSLQDLQSTALIIGFFAAVWVGMFLALLGVEAWRLKGRHQRAVKNYRTVTPEQALVARHKGTYHKRQSIDNRSLEDSLCAYITELFSPAFSDSTDTNRLLQELWTKHEYLSVLSTELSYEQRIRAYYLLTNLTANFFFLALFYDIQFPSDDGSCALQSNETDCLSRKSLFNADTTKCLWNEVHEGCKWQRPHIELYSAVIVSMVVLLISVPVSLLVSWLCESILLAPTIHDVEHQASDMRVRRASAVQKLDSRAVNPPALNPFLATKGKSASLKTLFGKVSEMDTNMQRATFLAHRLSNQTSGLMSNGDHGRPKRQLDKGTDDYYLSYHNFIDALQSFYRRKEEELSRLPPSTAKLSASELRQLKLMEEFEAVWIPVLYDSHNNAKKELESVLTFAKGWINKLQGLPQEQIGVQILELFVRDCLGQHSREATIFSQKIHPLRDKYVLAWGIKCFVFSCLILLNLYFIFACMLYGHDKGFHWQKGWLYACCVNFLIEIFINSVTVAAAIHFLVPNLIVDKARHIKSSVARVIHVLCTGTYPGQLGTHTFSVTDFYFVSAHVARAFPTLLESRIVLATQSFVLSHEQLLKINPAFREPKTVCEPPQRHNNRHTVEPDSRPTLSRRNIMTGPSNDSGPHALSHIIGFSLTTIFLAFGSQSVTVQEIIMGLLNPGVISITAYIGLAFSKRSSAGIIGGIFVMSLGLAALFYACRHYINEYYRLRHRSPRITPTLTRLELEFIGCSETNVVAEISLKHSQQSQSVDRSRCRHHSPAEAALEDTCVSKVSRNFLPPLRRPLHNHSGGDSLWADIRNEFKLPPALKKHLDQGPGKEIDAIHISNDSHSNGDGLIWADIRNDFKLPSALKEHFEREKLQPSNLQFTKGTCGADDPFCGYTSASEASSIETDSKESIGLCDSSSSSHFHPENLRVKRCYPPLPADCVEGRMQKLYQRTAPMNRMQQVILTVHTDILLKWRRFPIYLLLPTRPRTSASRSMMTQIVPVQSVMRTKIGNMNRTLNLDTTPMTAYLADIS
jgi:hypothetical protein